MSKWYIGKTWVESLDLCGFESPNLSTMSTNKRRALSHMLYQATGELSGYIPDMRKMEDASLPSSEFHLWCAVDNGITVLMDALAAMEWEEDGDGDDA